MRKAKTKLFCAVGLGLLLTSATAAADGYGPAGCGLGSIIFSPGSTFTQLLAATTNGSSGSQTFGISSGTSNCDAAPATASSAKAFVVTNRAALAKEIARGGGETISSLTALAGCQDASQVGTTLQRNFRSIFPNASVSDQQVSESVMGVLKSEQSLSCSALAG